MVRLLLHSFVNCFSYSKTFDSPEKFELVIVQGKSTIKETTQNWGHGCIDIEDRNWKECEWNNALM